MAKRKESGDEWLELNQAVAAMSEHHGRPITPGAIINLRLDNKVVAKRKDGRTWLYLKSSLLSYPLKQQKPKQEATS